MSGGAEQRAQRKGISLEPKERMEKIKSYGKTGTITEDEKIQKDIVEFVEKNEGRVDLFDIAKHMQKDLGHSRMRAKEWFFNLILEGVLEDGPSRMITIRRDGKKPEEYM
jgi:hypothetical protein